MLTYATGLDLPAVQASAGYIYRITNRVTGISYIGKSTNLDATAITDYLGSGDFLRQEIERVGRPSFDKQIIAIAATALDLDVLEIQAIAAARAAGEELCNGGVGGPRIQAPWLGVVLREHSVHPRMRDDWLAFVTDNEEDLREVVAATTANTNVDVDYAHLSAIWRITQDLTLPCPSCAAEAGELCHTKTGRPSANHAARRHAAAASPTGGTVTAGRRCSRCGQPGHYRPGCPGQGGT